MLRERFRRPLDSAAARLSGSTREDAALLGVDLWGSLAHARMLGTTGIIPRASARRIERGLVELGRRWLAGTWRLDAGLEDVHLNVESELGKRIGEDGARLHTGRSRNDQVATDLALYTREALAAAGGKSLELAAALARVAHGPAGQGTVTGWTHLQPAQRLYWSGLLGAHALRFVRDAERFGAIRRALRYSPLGSGAIAGSSLPLDRFLTARLLAFDGPTPSSVDAVSDRDSTLEALFAISLAHVHASQLGEELVIGAMPEVGRVELSDAFVTTSSLMPHKRNPDLAELVRAESAGAIGRLTAALALLRSLPMGYQRDLQAAKPILFEGFEHLGATLDVLTPMVAGARYLARPTQDRSTASVEIADELVRAGVPFRTAHRRVALFLSGLPEKDRGLAGPGVATRIGRAFPELAGRGFDLPAPSEEPERRRTFGGSARREVDRLLALVDARRRAEARDLARVRAKWAERRAEFHLPERLFDDPLAGSVRKNGPGG